ncbi:MAG: carboxypeptidase regulatory-like domain-containing protein [Acidimicrobiia bacterium]|nr:carboxypeptidase regulatory-like domain-containing protein [Acidimicrobiia bacterium]
MIRDRLHLRNVMTPDLARLAIVLAAWAGLARLAQNERISGLVHESAPSESTVVANARVTVSGGSSSAIATTGADGRFTLDVAPTVGLALEIASSGYETAHVTIEDVSRARRLDIALTPIPGDIQLTRSGTNDCADLPKSPIGVPGLREYARIAVHHDGILTVTSAQLPFFNNPGYVYRQAGDTWEPNESDYVLLRSPIPLLGGSVYVITFGGDKDLCGPWSIDATHPR